MSAARPLDTQPGTPPDMRTALELERIASGRLVGTAHTFLGTGRMFGGEVAAQAVMAAHDGIPEDRSLHSLHGYFLLPGDPDAPLLHEVDRTRDGGSFTTRTVRTVQDAGVVFTLLASFQRREEGFEHGPTAPEVAGPDDSATVNDRLAAMDEGPLANWLAAMGDIFSWEFRFPEPPMHPREPSDAPRHTWFRVRGDLPADDAGAHAAALTHGSDLFLLSSALQRHGMGFGTPGLFVTSLDHAMWFHRPPRVDDWLLYEQRSEWAGNARTLCRGRFWTTDGELVATVSQEGLVRLPS